LICCAGHCPYNAGNDQHSNFRALKHFFLLVCLSILALSPALAEKADSKKPLNVEADNLKRDELRQLSVFTGKVLATKGTIVMRGERLEVRQDPDGFQYGVIKPSPGQRGFFRQKREGVEEWIEGEGELIEYDGKADRLTLLGRAEFRRYRGTVLSDQMTGQRIIYENLTDQFTVDGLVGGVKPANSSGRIRAVLTPKSDDEAAK
jgi:lipopolysaccharide export system protein LptA